jgi:teichoic acid ribitol-phosphate primase
MSPRLVVRPFVGAGYFIGRLLGRPRRRVTLATAHADAIGGNLEFIRRELARRVPPIPVSVVAYPVGSGWRGAAATILGSLRAGFALARSRVTVVDDYFLPMYLVRPRPQTRYVQVWHAAGAFKKFGYSVLEKSFGTTEAAVRERPIHTNYDVCLVSSMRFAPFYAEAFRQPLERFDASIGIPRTDVFFGAQRAAAEQRVREQLPLGGRRSILYAPTFRGTSIARARTPDDLDLRHLREVLGPDHVVLLRRHPFARPAGPLDPALDGFVIDVSDHPDINELMLVSDVLVTDYSSAIYEFSLLVRPMAFFAPDHAAYERERGFYFDYREGVPGPVFETTEELARYLRAGQFDLDRVARFRDESFDVADGHASERFVDRIVLPALR